MWDLHWQTKGVRISCINWLNYLFKCQRIPALRPIDKTCDSNFKTISFYYNEEVECGGKKGDSVMLKMTVCGTYLIIYKIKVYYPVVTPGKWYLVFKGHSQKIISILCNYRCKCLPGILDESFLYKNIIQLRYHLKIPRFHSLLTCRFFFPQTSVLWFWIR